MKKLIAGARLLPALVITSGLLYAVSQAAILVILEPLGTGPPAFQFSFGSKSLGNIIAAWGDPGVAVFMNHLYIDFLHPVIYSSFMFFLLCYLRMKLPVSKISEDIPVYFLLPFAAAAVDLGENFLELAIISRHGDVPGWMALLNGLLSSSKWALAAASMAIIALFAARVAAGRIQSGKGDTV